MSIANLTNELIMYGDLSRDVEDLILQVERELAQAQKRLQWLIDHCDYIEHTDRNGCPAREQPTGGWWPQTSDQDANLVEPDALGLDLIEYIDRQIELNDEH